LSSLPCWLGKHRLLPEAPKPKAA